MSYRVRLLTLKAALQRQSQDAVRCIGRPLAFKNTSIEIADSALYCELAIIHIEVVVALLLRVKIRCLGWWGWPESILARKYIAQLIEINFFLRL
jgi:hypothetical protein